MLFPPHSPLLPSHTLCAAPPPHPTPQGRLRDYIETTLRPLALSAARCNAGAEASDAAWLHGGPHVTSDAAEEVRLVSVWVRSVAEDWGRQKHAALERLAALSPAEAETPAFCTPEFGRLIPTERSCFDILDYMQETASFNSSIPTRLGAAITPAEAAWVAEFDRGRALGRQLLSRVLAVLSEAKLCILRLCLSAVAQCLDLLEMWAHAASACFQQRETWMRAFIAVYGSGQRGTLIFRVPESIEARGWGAGVSLRARACRAAQPV